MKTLKYEKWDVHHHLIPEFYVNELKSMGISRIFGLKQPAWTVDKSLKMMKKHNISKAFLSVSTPGVYFNDDGFSRRLARRSNEYMAGIIKKHPGKFGGFAALPLPDVDGALAEAKYALDVLRLDGIGLLSNVNGKYLGNSEYRTLFQELNRRNTIVLIHPTAPSGKSDHQMLNYMYLFMLDTTRTLVDFIRNGYHREFPNIKFILCHGGGILPAIYPNLIARLKEENQNIEVEMEKWKRQIYLDSARIAYHDTMSTAVDFSGINHILFGSDYMWAKNNYAYWIKLIKSLNTRAEYIQAIFKDNAEEALGSSTGSADLSVPGIKPHDFMNKATSSGIKYHYHCNPREIIDCIPILDASLSTDKIETWNMDRAVTWMKKNNYKKTMLSLDIPQLWSLKDSDTAQILRLYNNTVAEIRNANPDKLGAFGAIDINNAELALNEIDYCLNNLKLNGICIYTRIYDSALEDIFDERLMKKLKESNVPVLLHPKDSRGVPLANENYLDAVYFVSKMFYLDKSKYLEETKYILTHSGGIIPFLAQNIGLLYYIQVNKNKMGRFFFDWLITRNLKGYEYLRRVLIDD